MYNKSVNRNDRYEDYTHTLFKYKYPYTWEERSFNYLEVLPDRDFKEEQDYMFPRMYADDRYYNGN